MTSGTLARPAVARVRESAFSATRTRPPRIGVLYPSGAGNLGDEAILQATFASLRAHWPDAELRAFTLYPTRTAANHGVEAEPLTGINRKLFGAPRGDGPLHVRAGWAIARRTRGVPILGAITQSTAQWVAALTFEAASVARAWRWLQDADLVLASGGGQLDAVWGGTWGQPYALARWAWLAGRAGVPFAFLSVGYGGARTGLSKRFLQYAVSKASYCSIRDTGSRTLAEQLGARADLPIVPDLAFALEPREQFAPRRPGYDIGISPMVYLRPGSWPIEDAVKYDQQLALWADLVVSRVANGDRVHLFVTDPADMDAVHEVLARVDDRTRAACTIAQANTPNALLEFFRGLDVVVSSRLHGVLLAIVAGRPVLALSHERKVRAVMCDAGVTPFCMELSGATLDGVTERLADLTEQLDACAEGLRGYAASARAAVSRQEALLPQLLRQM